MSGEEAGRLGHNPPIWHRPGSDWPFIVWEGDPDGAASGRAYRRRWRAILAAWWASRYAQQDVWVEHRTPWRPDRADRTGVSDVSESWRVKPDHRNPEHEEPPASGP